MKAKDVMSAPAVTVPADCPVKEIARTLLTSRISAVPVTDESGKIVGIVSEGDLLRRAESGTARHPSWWLGLFSDPAERAVSYLKSHGPLARDVMTREVVSVTEETDIAAIATLLESRRIKRVPVMRDGKVVGIVSRANLLHGLAAAGAPKPAGADAETIRERIIETLDKDVGLSGEIINVTVAEGVVHLWGAVVSEAQKRAIRVAAEEAAPGYRIDEHIGTAPQQQYTF